MDSELWERDRGFEADSGPDPWSQCVFAFAGYLKAVWPDLLGAFLRSGRPWGPQKALKSVGGKAPPPF